MKTEEPKTEREVMMAAQTALRAFKRHLAHLRKINEAAGRLREANAVFLIEGKLAVLHAEATEKLHEFWPEHASEIQTRGGDR